MDETKKFTCGRCNEIVDEKGNVFFWSILFLLILGMGFFHVENNICKDCAGFLNFIAFSLLIFLSIILFIVTVIIFL